jgi:hypothetical protein
LFNVALRAPSLRWNWTRRSPLAGSRLRLQPGE